MSDTLKALLENDRRNLEHYNRGMGYGANGGLWASVLADVVLHFEEARDQAATDAFDADTYDLASENLSYAADIIRRSRAPR